MNFSASNSIIVRIEIANRDGMLAKAMLTISEAGATIGSIDLITVERDVVIRDITIFAKSPEHINQIIERVNAVEGLNILHVNDRTFLMHLGGKIEVTCKAPINNRDDLSMAYTPGVARVCEAIHDDPEKAYALTIKRNTVAIVSDGTAVLGLGDIGPEAAMPVMEGKAMLFKNFGGIDGFPICLATKDVDEIVNTVKYLAPTFGGINLEDISAPRCFEIETRLKKELDIPVFHDDQHGTAVVMCAGLINALKIVNKQLSQLKIVVNGVGAAGMACSKMLMHLGVTHIIGCDTKGILHKGRKDLNSVKQDFVAISNPENVTGTLQDAMHGADVFIGLSAPNTLTVADLKAMNKDPIVFAMANPKPEIMPEIAYPHVAVMATGRSDYPNQINNVLAFPGIFRGALDLRCSDINNEMLVAAAYAIANTIDEKLLRADYIIPSVFDQSVVPAVAEAVKQAAIETGVARKSSVTRKTS